MRHPDYITDSVLSAFTEMGGHPARMLVLRGYERHADVLGMAGDPVGARLVEGGRAAHPLVELSDGERAMVRRYHRGGAVRHINRTRYFLGRRSYHELWVTERARAAGVNVPIMLAAAERRHALGYSAWLASRWIPDAQDLVAWLAAGSSSAGEEMLERAGAQAGLMHGGGIAHPDLNLRNVLVGGAGRSGQTVYLLDFDRGRVFDGPVPARRRRADLERLARSARKLAALVPPRGWLAFRAGYGAGWPAGLTLR